MSSEKTIKQPPFKNDDDDDPDLTKSDVITKAIEGLPNLDPSAMGTLVTKINQAVVLDLIHLNAGQLSCLRQLSTKYIPDAPKQIHLKAEIKTENVILGWLRDNEEFLNDAMEYTQTLAPAQDANYALLEDFEP